MKQKNTFSYNKWTKVLFISFALVFSLILVSCGQNNVKTNYHDNTEITGLKHYDGYELTQSTIVSRHNLRSTEPEPGDPFKNYTTLETLPFTSSPGDLTLQGAEEETLMGQYFRKYFASEKLFTENEIPNGDEAYFYSNSNQRTIATAYSFGNGLFPIAPINVDYKFDLGVHDPVFSRKITKSSQEYKDQINKEVKDRHDGKDYAEIEKSLEPNFKKLEDFVGFKDSNYAKENNLEHLPLGNIEMDLNPGSGVSMKGSLRDGNILVDVIKMQYYAQEEDSKAFFGKNISYKDFMDICEIDDVYQEVMHRNYTYGIDRTNLLLKEISADIDNSNRKISFLCGHDNTLMSLLAALKIKDYILPNTIDARTPIGSKIVFNKFKNKNNEEFCSLNLVYETADQIRHREALNLDNPPMAFQLELEGLNKNSDGLYKLSDVKNRLNESIAEYDLWN